MINYWPTEDMEVYLRLQSRVESHMALADTAASGDDDPLNEFTYEQAQMELNFRDAQLKHLRENVPDLDDFSDGVVMSDFTLDYFFAQLLKYLERNRAELEATPKGAYAVSFNENSPTETGVIFFLRQLNTTTDKKKKTPSPVYPYYTVYIRKNGDIRYGCANAKQVLDLFEASAIGKDDVLSGLCLQFDQETQHGKNMGDYNKLPNTVIAHITRSHMTKTQNKEVNMLKEPWQTCILVFCICIVLSYCGSQIYIALQEDTRKRDVIRIAESLGMKVIENNSNCSCQDCSCTKTIKGEPDEKIDKK